MNQHLMIEYLTARMGLMIAILYSILLDSNDDRKGRLEELEETSRPRNLLWEELLLT